MPEHGDPSALPLPLRLLLPVPGLTISRTWKVGLTLFHPGDTAAGLVEEARRGLGPNLPGWFQDASDRTAADLAQWAVAEVEVSGGVDAAILLVEEALAVLRAVQHMESPTSAAKIQTFGLPGQATSALISYFSLSGAAPGWKRTGVLGGWSFGDESHAAWSKAAEYRFLDEALGQADGDRTPLQRRALVAIELLSQAWLSWQPDTAFLSAVVALEALLGEPGDSAKKFRIARRVSYFICGWLEGPYTAGGRPACPLLALPLTARGRGPELEQLISDIKTGALPPCTQFLSVLRLYDDRSKLVHGGYLGLTANEESQATWFIAAWLLRPVLRWFSEHPAASLSDLDEEIAALPAAPPPAE
jgi:Apea-like HEPN